MIAMKCAGCGYTGNTPDEMAGKIVPCPKCRASVSVPSLVEEPAIDPGKPERVAPKTAPVPPSPRGTTTRKILIALAVFMGCMLASGVIAVALLLHASQELRRQREMEHREQAKEDEEAGRLKAIEIEVDE